MKIALLVLLSVACVPRLTKFRGGFSNCASVSIEQGRVSCGSRLVATVECFLPRQQTCAALAVRYPDGERVFLYQPPLFNPNHSEEFAANTDDFALRPQMAEDGTFIWFRRSDAHSGNWEAFEMDTGALLEADSRSVFDQQSHHGARPLWTLPDAGKEAGQ
jgi:hypothetical protein